MCRNENESYWLLISIYKSSNEIMSVLFLYRFQFNLILGLKYNWCNLTCVIIQSGTFKKIFKLNGLILILIYNFFGILYKFAPSNAKPCVKFFNAKPHVKNPVLNPMFLLKLLLKHRYNYYYKLLKCSFLFKYLHIYFISVRSFILLFIPSYNFQNKILIKYGLFVLTSIVG